MTKPKIGISLGDINGVGPEIIIKIFSDSRMMEYCTPIVFGSGKVIAFYKKLYPDFPLNSTVIHNFEEAKPKYLNIFSCWEENVEIKPGTLTDVGGKYAIRSLEVAVQCLKDGQIDAIVTAPIHKRNTASEHFKHAGHTPYLKEVFGVREVVMMLNSGALRVAVQTDHIPLSEVATTISISSIKEKIRILHDTMIKDFGIDAPKIAVLGLNPHAGDQGLLGHEEHTIIEPAIIEMQQQGILAFGPYSADAFFARGSYNEFDIVLAMYHDQGLIPFKTIASNSGINYTCGLPVVRTSPDHGVAFDIAGKGLADINSMREAVFQAIDILRNRAENAEASANPLKRQARVRERHH